MLSRVIRWKPQGWQLEADPRHAELIVEHLQLHDQKPLCIPYPDYDDKDDEHGMVELAGPDIASYRGAAARITYVSFGPSRHYARCKRSLQRHVQTPCVISVPDPSDWPLPHRNTWADLVCWLPNTARSAAHTFRQQLGGLQKLQESTSGGAASIGSHTIKCWANTQAIVAKSSAAAELYAAVRGACEGLGLATLYQDVGFDVQGDLFVYARATTGMIERRGICTIRRLDVDTLWLRDQLARRLLPVETVLGTLNPADLMTKGLPFFC